MALGIVSAMHEELSAVLERVQARPVERAGRTFWQGHWLGVPVVAVLSRIGKVAAATTVTTLIQRFEVDQVVMTGVAGGLAESVQVGDAVVAHAFVQHDLDASPLFPRYEVPLYGLSRFGVDARLTDWLTQSAQQVLSHTSWQAALAELTHRAGGVQTTPMAGATQGHAVPRLHSGLIASGDRFVSSAQESQTLRSELPDALAVEMEGAAMAQVCHDHGVPFAGVRLISDRADDAAHVDFVRFIRDVAAPASAAVMQGLVQRLQ
jgi:adenosylhomocysteine nucleosidase